MFENSNFKYQDTTIASDLTRVLKREVKSYEKVITSYCLIFKYKSTSSDVTLSSFELTLLLRNRPLEELTVLHNV